MELNSCLYETSIMHCRTRPKRHRFNHMIFMFYLDLDELEILPARLRLFGRNQGRLYNFRDDDHFRRDRLDIKSKLMDYLAQHGIALEGGRIKVLTNVRCFGYVFNPVSFYFCFDAAGRPVCAVPEIGNTFGEIKPYFIGQEHFNDGRFECRQKKYFYISPFVDLDVPMDMRLAIPEERLNIKIDDYDAEGRFLYTVLSGQRLALTDRNLLKATFKYPLVTLQVILLIHIHALLLWLKKIPYHEKTSNLHLQKEVYRVWNHSGKQTG